MSIKIPPPADWAHDPAALRAFLKEHNLSGGAAGALIGVDGRTIRKWTGSERDMPYSAWYCLVHRAAEIASRERR